MTNETIELEAVHFPVRDATEAEDAVGGYASVEGHACAREHGATVWSEALEVDVPDASPWPDDVVGRRILVRGRLVKGPRGWTFESATYEVQEE